MQVECASICRMSYTNFTRRVATPRFLLYMLSLTFVLAFVPAASAASWNGIEPLKSRRADVERALGKPLADKMGEDGNLHFRVAGGTVTVAFVSRRFVENKKLNPDLEGTVLQIILQHDNSSDTPESLNLANNKDFKRGDERGNVIVFHNDRDGIHYTFVNNRLKTTRYALTAQQQKG